MHLAHEDDGAGALSVHVRETSLASEKRPIQMNGQKFLPVIKGEIFQLVHDLDAGIRGEHVHPAPAVQPTIQAEREE